MGLKSFLGLKSSRARTNGSGKGPFEELVESVPILHESFSDANESERNCISKTHQGEHNVPSLRKRRSFFGRQPDAQEAIPNVPQLEHVRNEHFSRLETGTEPRVRPKTAADVESHMHRNGFRQDDERKSQRLSLSRRLSRTFSKTNLHQLARNGTDDEPSVVPPVPPVPVLVNGATKHSAAVTPSVEKRKSRRISTGEGLSQKSSQAPALRKRRSQLWTSSNPDLDDSAVPPTPALVRDNIPTPDSQRSVNDLERDDCANRFWDRSGRQNEKFTQEAGGRRREALSVRPKSSYVPRSAAQGFLSSTNTASDATRRSWRKSAMCNDEEPMVCLTEEHRQEWEKMKQLMEALEAVAVSRQNVPDDCRRSCESVNPFSNSQALAALEFGPS